MRTSISLLAAVVAGLWLTGCAGPEAKLGRGINNSMEILRWGEMNRSVEQASLFEGPNNGFSTGVVRGFNKSIARAGVGLYEVLTFPIPTYDPICTSYLTPNANFPDSYRPGLRDITSLNTDDRIWFSGGSIMPLVPGNRFRVFDN